MIPFDQIDKRLDALQKDRKWLAEITGRSPGAIRSALAPNASDQHRSELLQKVLSGAIETEEERRREHPAMPDRITIEAPTNEALEWNRLAAKQGIPVHEWAVIQLDKAAEEWAKQQAPRILLDPPANVIELPFYGTVAAGMPGGPLDIADGTHPVPGFYDPATHYVLRVNGQSMEPDYPDGSHVVCRKLKDGEFAKKGQDVIACDASGAYFKRLTYLTSINPEFPEMIPASAAPITAVVVGKV